MAVAESGLKVLALLFLFELRVVSFYLLIDLVNVDLVLFIVGLLSVVFAHFLGVVPLLLAVVESAYL